jgi:hypothetical protein
VERYRREQQQSQREQEVSPEHQQLQAKLQAEMERLQSLLPASIDPPPAGPTPYSETPEGYKGPIPDKLLEVTVVNEGKAAAYEVTGWLRLEASYLEPVPLFSRRANARFSPVENGVYTVRVGGTPHSPLMPTANARLRFRVAVAVQHSPGTTKIEYEFTAPIGAGDKNTKHLDIPAPVGS